MSDTATQEAEATEAPAEKVQHDWPAELSAVFVEASKQYSPAEDALSEDATKAVQDKFREIPAAARGTAQASALKAVLTEGNADGLEAVLDALNSMPKTSAAKGGTGRGRKTKPAVDPVDAGARVAAALLVGWAKLGEDPENGQAIAEKAQAWFQNEVELDEATRDEILGLADRAVKAASRTRGGSNSGSGTRASFKETLEDLINDSRIKTPAKITMSGGKGEPDIEAKILKSGKVKIDDREFDNLSAAAKFAKDPKAYDDKTSKVSLNGWDAWNIANPAGEGTVAVGTLRKA